VSDGGPDDLGMRDEYSGAYDDGPATGVRHLVEDVQQNEGDTLCCGADMFAVMVAGGALTDDADEVTCSASADWQAVEPPDAEDIARSMAHYARALRDESPTHRDHDGDVRFDPDRGVAVCGCGEVIDEGHDGAGYKPMGSPSNLPAQTAADPIMTDLPPIDPHRQYTPVDLERAILETVRRLDAGLAMQAQWQEVHERALYAYDKAAARARLRVKGGAKDVRDAEVRVACEREADDVAESRMRVEVIKAAMHTLRSVLSGYQSVGRSVGLLAQVGGGDGQAPYRRDRQAGPLT
jgi:hypothetical protein